MQHFQVLADTCFPFLCLNLMVMKRDIWRSSWDFPLNYVRFIHPPLCDIMFYPTFWYDIVRKPLPRCTSKSKSKFSKKKKATSDCMLWINHLNFSATDKKTKICKMSYRCFEVSKFANRDSIESFYIYFLPGALLLWTIPQRWLKS